MANCSWTVGTGSGSGVEEEEDEGEDGEEGEEGLEGAGVDGEDELEAGVEGAGVGVAEDEEAPFPQEANPMPERSRAREAIL